MTRSRQVGLRHDRHELHSDVHGNTDLAFVEPTARFDSRSLCNKSAKNDTSVFLLLSAITLVDSPNINNGIAATSNEKKSAFTLITAKR